LALQSAQALGWVVLVLLAVFTLRRLILIVAAALPARASVAGYEPSVAAIVAVRNEEANLPRLLEAFERLEYPREKLHFVFVNDGSLDATSRILHNWTRLHPNARLLEVATSEGKALALDRALDATPETELVAVYDADLAPSPASLGILAAVFQDVRVAAAAGFRRPSDAGANPITAYGALESFVHQLVTQAGKDRLCLNPTTLGGNCLYRRSALAAVGGFRPGAFSEDIETSLALVAAGWRTRFCRDAVSESVLLKSLGRYWNQRARWTRGIYSSARKARRPESWLVSAGYSDRLLFLAALALAATGQIRLVWPALYLLAPAVAIATALGRAGVGGKLAVYIVYWTIPMFVVDVAATVVATANTLLRRRLDWWTGGVQA
jgi:cellulose synthase/poly-beta-1,6-N-acetylglucosamine synthase-like glycosyltransferase